MFDNKQAYYNAVTNFIDQFKKDNYQPFFRCKNDGHLEDFSFDVQNSTTQSIIEDENNVIEIDNLVIGLKAFNELTETLGFTLIFDASKPSASSSDFKLVSLEEANEAPIQKIPKELENRSAHIDA